MSVEKTRYSGFSSVYMIFKSKVYASIMVCSYAIDSWVSFHQTFTCKSTCGNPNVRRNAK